MTATGLSGDGKVIEKKLEDTIDKSKFSGLSTICEMMFEVNCPNTLAETKGIGSDNMTCIIIEFNTDQLPEKKVIKQNAQNADCIKGVKDKVDEVKNPVKETIIDKITKSIDNKVEAQAMDKLEETLSKSMWVGGDRYSQADQETFMRLGFKGVAPSVKTNPHTFAWYTVCSRFAWA